MPNQTDTDSKVQTVDSKTQTADVASVSELQKVDATANIVQVTPGKTALVQQKPAAKPSILDNIKGLFGKKTADGKAQIAGSNTQTADGKEQPLTAEERKEILETEKLYNEGLTSIRDIIAPASYEVFYDHINVEGLYAQSYYVYAYPRYLETNWLSPIVNFEVTMDVSQFIYPVGSAQIMRTLKRKVAQFQASLRMNREKGNVSDPALETALEDAEQLRTELQRGQEKFFQFGMYMTIYSDDMKKLQKITKQLESLLGGKLILTKKANLQQEYAFNSTIPICLDELQVNSNMNTSPLSSTFPFISSELTSNDGILYGLNRHNESLVVFDRFSLENANSVVFAKSGAGKSYAIKLEVLRYLMMGVDVIVIDPENEYESLAESVGGSYLRVSLNSDKRINPFDLPAPVDQAELKPGDLLRSAIIDLTGLMKLMMGDMTPTQEGILDRALIDVYATKGITMDTPNPSQFNPPTMEDFHAVLSSMDGAEDMAQRIQKFTTGTYSGVFNKPTNVNLDKGLVVFSVRDLEDQLRPIAMYIILSYIWNRVRSELKKRILVIDEAWSMMQHDDSAKFLFGLVKRARKYYLGVSTITQDVEDFMRSDFGKPIITNSSMQILLKQSPTAMEMLQKVFNLTEGEKYMLLNSGVGQGLFFAGLKHVALQIIASYTEDKIITTNPEEILKGRSERIFENAEKEQNADDKAQTADDKTQTADDKTQPAEGDTQNVESADYTFDNTSQLLGNLEQTKEVAEARIESQDVMQTADNKTQMVESDSQELVVGSSVAVPTDQPVMRPVSSEIVSPQSENTQPAEVTPEPPVS
ncbi:conjugal transfer protein TraC [Candidatus Peregrinibacteria bacterium CG22_combo_CG10-13_8_21_14_all_44_10]|nr:MAG: hypothetical protein AUK45_00180 [Candidatus Peregrinibacteria bacterium CG2_30_44_17]PIP66351.1 MAG: conjugal transfer protein TraC [Candidatus Peregrinibacteria bacterium CG22_combo_CG10-13_8_21_14_all_44_10]